jgi:2-methylcitrate dehydratase PrpD
MLTDGTTVTEYVVPFMITGICRRGREEGMLATASEQLARLAHDVRLSDLPEECIQRVKNHILDSLGVAFVGAQAPWISPVREYALTFGSRGRSTLIGPRCDKLDAEDAAIFNATAAHTSEMDDHHLSSTHPGCSVVQACLSVAEDASATGADYLLATIIAFEVATRVAMATTTSLVFDRGFHNCAVFNGFGVAAGSGRLIGLDGAELAHALAIAADHASGLLVNGRTAAGCLHGGTPAASGIRSARLAKLGLTGAANIFDHYLEAFSDDSKPELLTQGLGDDWIGVAGLRLKKPYACAGNIAPPIDALQRILSQHAIKTSDIKEIRVGVDRFMFHVVPFAPEPDKLVGITDPTVVHFSIHYQLGIAAVKGHTDFPTFVDLASRGFDDPEVLEVARLVNVVLDPEAEALFPQKWMTKVTVFTRDGKAFEEKAFAMTEPDPEEKFGELLQPILPGTHIDALIQRVAAIEELEHIEELTALLVTPAEP